MCFPYVNLKSFTAFQRRRAIRRFLTGDLQDGMDDKGKNMFPMNGTLPLLTQLLIDI